MKSYLCNSQSKINIRYIKHNLYNLKTHGLDFTLYAKHIKRINLIKSMMAKYTFYYKVGIAYLKKENEANT